MVSCAAIEAFEEVRRSERSPSKDTRMTVPDFELVKRAAAEEPNGTTLDSLLSVTLYFSTSRRIFKWLGKFFA